MKERIAFTAEEASQMPETPGCYWFEDESGNVMYIGKSICLKKRVFSYFGHLTLSDPRELANQHNAYTRKRECMIRFVKTIGYTQTETELDALLLEHRLIKQYRPMYNEVMRHDRKSWFIHIPQDEAFPPLLAEHRDVRESGTTGMYDIGPFYNRYSLEEAMQVITDFWQLPRCGKHFYACGFENEPCLRFYLKQCLAPCAGEADQTLYHGRLTDAARFFQGDGTAARERVKKELRIHTDNLDFERAAVMRDVYNALCLWVKRLTKHPLDWRARYVIYAKAFHEDCFMAAYAGEGRIQAWVYTDEPRLTEELEELARFIFRDGYRSKKLCFPASREEGGRLWTAMADISAVKHYIRYPANENRREQETLLFLRGHAEEFLKKIHKNSSDR
jgi:excinuclease ABC subunit C